MVTDQQVVLLRQRTNGKKDTADIGSHGWDEHTVSAKVAVWTLAVRDRARALVADPD